VSKLRVLMLSALFTAVGTVGMCVRVNAEQAAHNAGTIDCENLTVTVSSDKNYYIFTATTSGDGDAIAGYTFSFGDHQSYRFSFSGHSDQDHHTATATHTYFKDGVYTATAQALDKSGRTTGPTCQASVTNGQDTSTLPNTGAGNIIGIFIGTVVIGASIHQLLLRQRN
jgi:hypothetical protein